METYELEALLGDAAGELRAKRGEDGVRDLLCVLGDLAGHFGEDAQDEDGEAASGATMLALGDATLATLATEVQQARSAERMAMARLIGAIRWAADAESMSEAEIVRATGLARMTVRRAMGL